MTRVLQFLGDSHFIAVEAAIRDGLFAPYECRSRRVAGATAVGLRHPTSKTEALKVFREHLEPVVPRIVPIFQVGEVDCGFVIWVRAQRYGESISQQLAASLDAYQAFLRSVRLTGYPDVIVTSAVLPTIRDGELDGDVALLRAEVKAGQRDRTNLTLEYNARMSNWCESEGFAFVDLVPDLLDPRTRLLDERFRHPDPKDHHLNPATVGPIWAARVIAAVETLPESDPAP